MGARTCLLLNRGRCMRLRVQQLALKPHQPSLLISDPPVQCHHARQDQVICRVGTSGPGDRECGPCRCHQPGHHPGGWAVPKHGLGVDAFWVWAGWLTVPPTWTSSRWGAGAADSWLGLVLNRCNVLDGMQLAARLPDPWQRGVSAGVHHVCVPCYPVNLPCSHTCPHLPRPAGGGVCEGGGQACVPAGVPAEDAAARPRLCGCVPGGDAAAVCDGRAYVDHPQQHQTPPARQSPCRPNSPLQPHKLCVKPLPSA